jgi:hypothetical protein
MDKRHLTEGPIVSPPSVRKPSRHRKPPPAGPVWRSKAIRVAALVAAALLVFAWPAAARWLPGGPSLGWVNEVDGSGPVYALGNAVITNATGTNGGWPGGGLITYQLTDGPVAGLMVYLAEAGGIGGGGPFPTRVGVNFDELLQSLGVPAAPNSGQAAFGILPARYPAPGAVA